LSILGTGDFQASLEERKTVALERIAASLETIVHNIHEKAVYSALFEP
jgi:hypothetical protein